jgi:hypothetical protein
VLAFLRKSKLVTYFKNIFILWFKNYMVISIPESARLVKKIIVLPAMNLCRREFGTIYYTYSSSKDLGFLSRFRLPIPDGCSKRPQNSLSSS